MTQMLAPSEANRLAHPPGAEGDIISYNESTGVLEVLSPATRAEIDIQISTAKAYPRSIKQFKDMAMALACLDEETASGCFYALPRGGKPIEGPSVRLAEIVLNSWGNVRAESRVIDIGARQITAEAMCWDLERNVAVRVQVKRRITDKNGRRYNDDMITVTGNAACAIALRNAVFKVIPMAFTNSIYNAARQVAVGNAQTLAGKRAQMVEYFGKMGAMPDRVCAAVGRAGVEDITLDDLVVLKGLATAIKEGDTTVDEAFPVPKADGDDDKPRSKKLAEKIATPKAEAAQADGDSAAPPIPDNLMNRLDTLHNCLGGSEGEYQSIDAVWAEVYRRSQDEGKEPNDVIGAWIVASKKK